MKKNGADQSSRVARRIALLVLSLLFVLQVGAADEIVSGLRYQHRSEPGPLSIHWLEVDPRRISLELKHAGKGGLGRQTVPAIALEHRALAAVNGGFFTIGGPFDGKPAGILKVGERWLSDSSLPRGVIGWRRAGLDVLIGRLRISWSLRMGKRRISVDRINSPRGRSSAIVYTGGFDTSTRADPGGCEVIIADGRIAEITGVGNAPIPENGFVYSVAKERNERVDDFRPGMLARLDLRFKLRLQAGPSPRVRWSQMDFILGGTPILVSKGRAMTDFGEERVQDSFVTTRHPRTAVGIRQDGSWILLVVDGRQEQKSIGMTLHELATYLLSLGCVRALNLDGGGSSTLVVNGEIRNSPSDPTGPRPVSDAILLFPRNDGDSPRRGQTRPPATRSSSSRSGRSE